MTDNPDADVPTEFALPGVLAEIARLTTTETAIAFARRHGGGEMYIPEEPKRAHPLVMMLGRPAALVICQRYKGEHLRVPSARTYIRWYEARRLRRQGKSISQIARTLGIGNRRVTQLTHGIKAAPSAQRDEAPAVQFRCPSCGRKIGHIRHSSDLRQGELFDP